MFKPIPTKQLWADAVLDKPQEYRYDPERYDADDTGEGWSRILPEFDCLDPQEIVACLGDHTFDCPREEGEDYHDYVDRIRAAAEDFTAEHEYDLPLEPLVGFAYHLGNEESSLQVRGEDGQPHILSAGHAQAILLAYGGSVCLVRIDGALCLALTGGGMDLSWDICEGYMLLGLLPPAHFEPPQMGGKQRTTRNLRILAACRRSYRLARQWMGQKLQHLRHVAERLEPVARK
jgi:hypothetical protein